MSNLYVVRLTEENVEDVISRIEFSEPEVNSEYGNVSINVTIEDEEGEKRKLVVETPWMRAFVGVSTFDAQSRKGGTYKKYNLPVSFNSLESDSKQQVYRRFIELFDEKLVETGFKNSGDWLKQKGQPKAVIKAFYSSLLKHSKNKDGTINENYPPRTQYKLPAYRGDGDDVNFSTQVYKDQNTRMSVLDIAKGAQVKNLVECTGVWVVNGKFGAGWRSLQMRVKNPESKYTYAFQEDSDSEEA